MTCCSGERILASTALILLVGALAVHPASADSSSAFGLQANFNFKGVTTGLGPLAPVSGSTPPAYSKSVSLGAVHQTVNLAPGVSPVPALFVDIKSIKTHASASGIQIDFQDAGGDATLKGVSVALMLNPPPPATSTVAPEPFLNLTADKIEVTTSFDQVFPQQPVAASEATFTGLQISGSLVGGQTIKFTGQVPNDTVLYQSPTVTITLSPRIIAALISCEPTCVVTPESVAGSAIDIALDKANLFGRIVSGDIRLAGAQAGALGLVSKPAEFDAGK